jgi:hypothetical protein
MFCARHNAVGNISPAGAMVSRTTIGLSGSGEGKSASTQVKAGVRAQRRVRASTGKPPDNPSDLRGTGSISARMLLYTGRRAHVEDLNGEAQLDLVISRT